MEVKGNCCRNSFFLWQKLKGAGAVRVRGLVTDEIVLGNVINQTTKAEQKYNSLLHYWVESKGMVFDINPVQKIILPKDKYYELLGIKDAEICDGPLFTNSYKDIAGPETYEFLLSPPTNKILI